MTEAGKLINHEPLTTGIAGAKAWRVRYVSRDVNGVAHEATGLVIAPAADGENRPIVTWCHGTTGLGDAACPSAQPDPAREMTLYYSAEATQQIDYGVPGLQGFIDAGWVVCATEPSVVRWHPVVRPRTTPSPATVVAATRTCVFILATIGR